MASSLEARLLADDDDACTAGSPRNIQQELRDDLRRQRNATASLFRRSMTIGQRVPTVDGGGGGSAHGGAVMGAQTVATTATHVDASWDASPAAAAAATTTPVSTALWALLTCSRINLLLAAFPLALAAHAAGWGPVPVFTLSFLTLIPAAFILGAATEDVADALGPNVGGLFNASTGNIPELTISISALKRGLFDVVATSLLGSILSNLTLLLGLCYIAANLPGSGRRAVMRRHGTLAVKVYSSMLLLACAALAVPPITARLPHDHLTPGGSIAVSRGAAVLLLIMYVAFLFFTMGTHAAPLEDEAAAAAAASAVEDGRGRSTARADAADADEEEDGSSEDDGDDRPPLPLPAAAVTLVLLTGLIASASDLLTGSIRAVTETTGIPQRLLSLCLVSLCGNATEHASAVLVARKGKIDLAHSIALGSSLQIVSFVLPLSVIAAWAMKIPFSLECVDPLLFFLLLLAVIHQQVVSGDGRSDWLTGVQLVCLYVIIVLPSAFMKA
jgi:Ca2+:H+ antiporter